MSGGIFTERWTRKPGNPAFCRASMYDSTSRGFHQCGRAPKVFRCVEGIEYGFCKQHDPEAVARRAAASTARYEAKWAAGRAEDARRTRQREAEAACKAALEQIAAGHNDPRALAAEVLAMFPEALSPLPTAEETK